MKNLTYKMTATMALAAGLLLNGCTDFSDDSSDTIDFFDGGSAGSSSLKVEKSESGFLVTWERSSGGYGEVIYTDDLDKTRGSGYPLTSNFGGTYTMPCTYASEDSQKVYYDCEPSNVSYHKYVTLVKGQTYYWLVSEGLDHQHGEVEAIMEYNDGSLTIRSY